MADPETPKPGQGDETPPEAPQPEMRADVGPEDAEIISEEPARPAAEIQEPAGQEATPDMLETVTPAPDQAEAGPQDRISAPEASDSNPMEPLLLSQPAATPEAPKAEPAPRPAPPPPAPQRSGFVPLVLGGVIAAGLGFGLAQWTPQGWPIQGQKTDLKPLEDKLATLDASLGEVRGQVTGLAEAPPPAPDAGLLERLTALETALAAVPAPADLTPLTDRLAGVEAQLAALAAQPVSTGDGGTGVAPAALAALAAEVAALKTDVATRQTGDATTAEELKTLAAETRAQLQEAETQAAQLKADAETAARAATLRAALGRVQAALDSGGAYSAALTDLQAAGMEVPPLLADAATGGLPTLASLQSSFPDAARTALDASLRAKVGDSYLERFSGFLRTQTGARSLTPREGDDPDAVLSRAEAALRAGDLHTAMTEIGALPAEGQAALAAWSAEAQRRLQAVEAVAALTASVDAS